MISFEVIPADCLLTNRLVMRSHYLVKVYKERLSDFATAAAQPAYVEALRSTFPSTQMFRGTGERTIGIAHFAFVSAMYLPVFKSKRPEHS